MVFSKRELEGYVKIDHRNSPGLSPAERLAAGLPVAMPIGAGEMLEAPTFTCSHCQKIVVINPNRQSERAYCSKCDHYVCNGCGAVMKAPGYVHRSWRQLIDEFVKSQNRGQIRTP